MTTPYGISLEQLEAGARVPAAEQVESVPVAHPVPEDGLAPQPDRDWFHSGG